jgi:hypothetical protein
LHITIRSYGAQGRGQKGTLLKTKIGGITAWTKRNKKDAKFMGRQKAGEEEKGRQKVQANIARRPKFYVPRFALPR